MKIAVGLFYLECNTQNPDLVTRDKFIFAEGEAILPYLHATELLRREACDIVPTIMASALPAGRMKEEDYWYFANKILDVLKREHDLDGVWLHLHGALEVENVGSGDLRLVKEIRRVVGPGVPISLTLDAHANNDAELADYTCCLRGYRTIPHSDQPEAEQDAVCVLLDVIRNRQAIRPALVTLPLIVSGEKGLSAKEPLRDLFAMAADLERRPEFASASVFMGNPWCDCPNSHLSVVVVPSREEYMEMTERECRTLAEAVFARRADFAFEVPILPPSEVLDAAVACDRRPVFISDSGDNTTGGATGEGTEMLRAVLEHTGLRGRKVLITPIFDAAAYAAVAGAAVGEQVEFTIGTGREPISRPVTIGGTIKAKGDLLGYLNVDSERSGGCITVTVNDNLDLALSSVPGSFITGGHFTAAGLRIDDYNIIVLKQGYLFAQLRPFAGASFLALTRGATYQFIEEIPFKRVVRPLYPFDPDVQF